MSDLLDRYGPSACIAGASEGIGAAFARELAAAGFSLVLIARRADPLEALAAELRALGTHVHTLAIDLAAPDLEATLESIASQHAIGLVVYNAALSIAAPFLQTPRADLRKVLDVNARGPLLAAHVFGSAMAARGRGGIVLLSSLTAFYASPYLAAYGATKAFDLSLGEALAHELGERGIDVVVCCAGATRTPGFLAAVAGRTAPRSMSPEAVARETLRALPRRGAFVPGTSNRLAQLLLSRFFPRRAAVRIMAAQTKGLLAPRQ